MVSNSIRKRIGIVILFVVGFGFVRKSTTLYIEDGLEIIIQLLIDIVFESHWNIKEVFERAFNKRKERRKRVILV